MGALLKDLRFAARSLMKRPGVTVVAVLSLGVGVGVTSTAFTLLNAMTLRDLPGIEAQDRLVQLGLATVDGSRGRVPSVLMAWPDIEALGEQTDLFAGVAAAGWTQTAVRWSDEPVVEDTEAVTSNYFEVLGTRPFMGRLLNETDDTPGAATAVLSHRIWEAMGSPADVVGRQVQVNGRPFTVVGVAPPHYTGMVPGDVTEGGTGPGLWVPLAEGPLVRPRWVGEDTRAPESRWLRVVARLADGVTHERLEAGLPGAAGALERSMPTLRRDAVLTHGNMRFGPGAGAGPVILLSALMMVPLLVLLIACANAANLLLARTTERRQELALRAALGASRGALIRQVLAESLLLSMAAGGLALMVAVWSRSIAELFAVRLSMVAPLDLRVFAFTFITAAGAGLLLGIFPALSASRPDVPGVLAGSARTTSSRGSARVRRGLVVAQVALSLVLLVAAGLFVRSAGYGLMVDSGLQEEGLTLVTLDLDILRYEEGEGRDLYERLLQSVRSMPGVEAAAFADLPPLQGLPQGRIALPDDEPSHGAPAGFAHVGDGYFTAAGVPLLAGREPRRNGDGGKEVVVSRAVVDRMWPDMDPLGRLVRAGGSEQGELLTVVGVAGNARSTLHVDPGPVVYFRRDEYAPLSTLYVRSARSSSTVAAIRALVRDMDPRLPLHTVETARTLRERELLPWRLMASGLGALGAIALALAVAGLYGVMAFSVARRTREIGIRVALGADRAGVLGMVLRESLRVVGLGLAVGGVLALVVAVLLRSMLFGVSPVDPLTWGALLTILVAVGALAAVIPARRAASVEPMKALAE